MVDISFIHLTLIGERYFDESTTVLVLHTSPISDVTNITCVLSNASKFQANIVFGVAIKFQDGVNLLVNQSLIQLSGQFSKFQPAFCVLFSTTGSYSFNLFQYVQLGIFNSRVQLNNMGVYSLIKCDSTILEKSQTMCKSIIQISVNIFVGDVAKSMKIFDLKIYDEIVYTYTIHSGVKQQILQYFQYFESKHELKYPINDQYSEFNVLPLDKVNSLSYQNDGYIVINQKSLYMIQAFAFRYTIKYYDISLDLILDIQQKNFENCRSFIGFIDVFPCRRSIICLSLCCQWMCHPFT